MRHSPISLLLLAAPLLAGCQSFYAAAGTFTGVNIASLAILGRTVPDAVVSLVRSSDCSAVRLEQGLSYCVPPDSALPTPEFCTHSLGTPDCWANPALLPGRPVALVDTPRQTSAQIAQGAHRWPEF